MAWNRYAHPNESSLICLECVPNTVCCEALAMSGAACPLHLPKLHAEVVALCLVVCALPVRKSKKSRRDILDAVLFHIIEPYA